MPYPAAPLLPQLLLINAKLLDLIPDTAILAYTRYDTATRYAAVLDVCARYQCVCYGIAGLIYLECLVE